MRPIRKSKIEAMSSNISTILEQEKIKSFAFSSVQTEITDSMSCSIGHNDSHIFLLCLKEIKSESEVLEIDEDLLFPPSITWKIELKKSIFTIDCLNPFHTKYGIETEIIFGCWFFDDQFSEAMSFYESIVGKENARIISSITGESFYWKSESTTNNAGCSRSDNSPEQGVPKSYR